MSYKRKTTLAGKVKNVVWYHTYQHTSPKRPRSKNQNITTEQQAKINERNACEKIDLIINENFMADDLYITYTYGAGEKTPTPEEAKVFFSKNLDRLRYLYKKNNFKLKYIGTTEHVKGRMHHHLLINNVGIGIKEIKKIWEFGFVTVKLYAGEPEDAERIAAYFIKESKNTFNTDQKVHGRRYISSRNLVIPEPKIENVPASTWREEIKPKGYYIVTERRGYTESGYPYRFVRMIKIPVYDEKRKCPHKLSI